MDKKLPDNQTHNAGVLILVFGPSGSGKDTLIDSAKNNFKGIRKVFFPQRLITRQDKKGEDHIPVTPAEYHDLLEADELFLHWEAHSLKYGISQDVRKKLEQGYTVILNISRKQIDTAKRKWPNTVLVQINVQNEMLLERLKKRGRENLSSIETRYNRRNIPATIKPDYIIDNSGKLESAVSVFNEVIEKYYTG